MFVTRSFNVMPKTTKQHLIARSDKSVAYMYVKDSVGLCCTIEANYIYIHVLTDTKHRAASLRQHS